jgi:mRNA export factor
MCFFFLLAESAMFGTSGFGGGGTSFLGSNVTAPSNHNPMKSFEVVSPPDDSVSCLKFSPGTLQQNFLIAGSWDNHVRCWEIDQTGKSIPKSQQSMQGPVLDVCWSDVSFKT